MNAFENYLRKFSYESIPAMKISSSQLVDLLPSGTVQAIDIRFKEEYALWNVPLFKNIPLAELPDRLDELHKDKLIVVICPYNVRSNIGMHYLKLKGYNVKYLSDGLTAFAALLTGSQADELYQRLNEA